jgi:hypothetical protein
MASQVEAVKWVPGTSFLVDGFNFQSDACTAYFLTHMHSDHTCGLPRRWQRAAPIYCSPLTAALLVADYGLKADEGVVVALPLGQRVVVQGVGVTALDANHCPGAVQLLFELPQPGGGMPESILHTGDFRWQPWMARLPALAPLAGRLDCLMLDCTYAAPRWDFPPQQQAIDTMVQVRSGMLLREGALAAVAAAAPSAPAHCPPGADSQPPAQVMRQELAAQPRTLLVVGSYHIGKERAYMGAAQALGLKVGAGRRRALALPHMRPGRCSRSQAAGHDGMRSCLTCHTQGRRPVEGGTALRRGRPGHTRS